MGRELKRVPLDFKWPNDQIWKGYLNPFHSQKCKPCDQTGYNPETKKLSDGWYPLWQYHLTEIEVEALLKSGRLNDLMDRRYRFDEAKNEWLYLDKSNEQPEWVLCEKPLAPSPESVNYWASHTMGHDAINKWICVEARAKHLGVFGKCEFCHGEGEIWISEEVKKLNEDWRPIEPPEGDGFQLWTTTSEGAPISPVFDTLESLCEYAQDNCTTFGYNKATKDEWMGMLDSNFVCHKEGNMIFI